MRVLVIGAGALGGYYGACLVRAGADVTFLCGAGGAIAAGWIAGREPAWRFRRAAEDPPGDELKEPFDVVLVGVKAYSLDDAMSQLPRPSVRAR